MALSSAFRERLEQMDQTRNQRLSLLQGEKELQARKSQILASKLANIRSMEQRCLMLDQKIASQNFKILSLRSEIESLDTKYRDRLEQLRVLKREVEELEGLEKEKERYYGLRREEMKEFSENVERFAAECRMRVEQLRNGRNELQSSFVKLQNGVGYTSNSEIAAAEAKRSELLAIKENLDTNLASNYQIRAQLQKQLHNILLKQVRERGKLPTFDENRGVK